MDATLTRYNDLLVNTTINGRVHKTPTTLGFQLLTHNQGVDKEIININWGGEINQTNVPTPSVVVTLIAPTLAQSSVITTDLTFRVDNIPFGSKLYAMYTQTGINQTIYLHSMCVLHVCMYLVYVDVDVDMDVSFHVYVLVPFFATWTVPINDWSNPVITHPIQVDVSVMQYFTITIISDDGSVYSTYNYNGWIIPGSSHNVGPITFPSTGTGTGTGMPTPTSEPSQVVSSSNHVTVGTMVGSVVGAFVMGVMVSCFVTYRVMVNKFGLSQTDSLQTHYTQQP